MKPCALPEQLQVRILRMVPKKGKEEKVEEFLEMMDRRREEAQPIINEDKMVCEVGFITEEGGQKLLYWLQILGAKPITVNPEIPVLKETYRYLEEVFDSTEKTVLLPQFAIFGEEALENILDYIRTE